MKTVLDTTLYLRSNPDIVDNVAAVFYALTTNDSVNELVRVLAYSSLSEITSVVRKVCVLKMVGIKLFV